MSRLFIVGIGGTGSRVIKAFTMLLAAGVKANSPYEVVPLIIDPHSENKDLQRTERLLEKYEKVRNTLGDHEGFFSTKILRLSTIAESVQTQAGTTYRFELTDMERPFKNYIGYSSLEYPDKLMADFLFSGKSINQRSQSIDLIDLNMNIGFVGNPHIGSVVLNQFKESEEYKLLTNHFGEDDRLLIISSIFGGTGAAGFPIVLKNIREGNSASNSALLQNAKVGAITLLPYFKVMEEENSPIRQSDFIAKTKSALMYYKHNITGEKRLNAMYYLSDNKSTTPIANDPGQQGQQNDAHFIEFVAALGILDFMNMDDRSLKTEHGRAVNPVYKHFGIKSDERSVEFVHLDEDTVNEVYEPMLSLALTEKYLKEELHHAVDSQVWSTEDTGGHLLKRAFFEQKHSFFNELAAFLEDYKQWFEEMAKNDRAFAPFLLDRQTAIANAVKGQSATKKKLFRHVEIGYDDFNDQLNAASRNLPFHSAEHKFVKVFSEAMADMVKKYYLLRQVN